MTDRRNDLHHSGPLATMARLKTQLPKDHDVARGSDSQVSIREQNQ